LSVGVMVALQTIGAPAQVKCDVKGPPYGPTPYIGTKGYEFNYWSHTGTVNGENFYQPGIKNVGQIPITIDWPDAGYFRRGIPSGKEEPGACDSDRNPLNTSAGLIKYGPNANFNGPTAKFFTRPNLQASSAAGPITFAIQWESILESGEKYMASVDVGSTMAGAASVRYSFVSKGRPIAIEWTGVLTQSALSVVRQQNASLVNGRRLVLGTSEPVQFTAVGDGLKVVTITAPLSISTPEGLLLYRDRHRGLALSSRQVGQ
jgi:hypothetical protein